MFSFKFPIKRILGITVIANALVFGVQNNLKAQQQDAVFMNVLTQAVNTMNDSLPMMIDRDVRWDSSSIVPGETMVYDYTLINYSSAQLDPTMFSQIITQTAVNEACTHPSLQIVYENGMSIQYNYYSNDDYLITNVEITPAECGY